MGLKDYAIAFLKLPGTIFSGITTIFFGSHKHDEDGEYLIKGRRVKANNDVEYLYDTNPSFIGFIASVFRSIGNFVADHTTEIAAAFWISLLVGGGVALAVAFWPAALAAIVSFQVAGLSIAAVVGTGFAAQVAAVGGLAAVAASALTYVAATFVNIGIGIRNYFANANDNDTSSYYDSEEDSEEAAGCCNGSAKKMADLSDTEAGHGANNQQPQPPHQGGFTFAPAGNADQTAAAAAAASDDKAPTL